MDKKRSLLLIPVLLLSISIFDDAFANPMYNSSEKFEVGYRVQVATVPEFPQIGEPSQFKVKVTKGFDYEDVERFTMGIRIFFNDQLVDTIPIESVEGSRWDFDYVWRSPGNHIVKIDLYDIGENQEMHTYTFNMGTQSLFGIIFILSITVGALCLAVVVGYIYYPKILKKFKI